VISTNVVIHFFFPCSRHVERVDRDRIFGRSHRPIGNYTWKACKLTCNIIWLYSDFEGKIRVKVVCTFNVCCFCNQYFCLKWSTTIGGGSRSLAVLTLKSLSQPVWSWTCLLYSIEKIDVRGRCYLQVRRSHCWLKSGSKLRFSSFLRCLLGRRNFVEVHRLIRNKSGPGLKYEVPHSLTESIENYYKSRPEHETVCSS
jgi:hypothetical protein